jgi:hypothetical protein
MNRAMARAAREMATATKRAMPTATNKAMAMAARGMAMVTRVAGNKEGDGKGARGGGVMVAIVHGLYVCFFVCGEITKISLEKK